MSKKIVRIFFETNRRRTIRTGITQEEAEAHCQDPETSSFKCTSPAARRRTRQYGAWMDVMYEE